MKRKSGDLHICEASGFSWREGRGCWCVNTGAPFSSIVQKTAEREAAREAAKESELSECKILYQEIKEKNSRTDQSSEASDPETKEN